MNPDQIPQPQNPDDNYFESDEEEFTPCDRCDGHDACADFGCAFALGLGHLVKKGDNDLWEW